MNISFTTKYSENVLSPHDVEDFIGKNQPLLARGIAGKIGMRDALGWFSVAENASQKMIATIQEIADEIRSNADLFVLVGVGGSNRSAQSVIEGLRKNDGRNPQIRYAGNNFSSQALSELLISFEGKSVYVNVIAKDFNTLEPGIAFRMIRDKLEKTYGTAYKERMILTGGFGEKQLESIAESEGFRFLPFPQRVGGRFSAFTAVGLLPMAAAGVDIQRLIDTAIKTETKIKTDPIENNIAVRYAVVRYLLSAKGFLIENLSYFEPCLEYFAKWWLQLHGETEGKCPSAVFPTTTSYSEDLHAIGQYIQEGRRFIFETFLNIFSHEDISIPTSEFTDGFEYLNGKCFDDLNRAVILAVRDAHFSDGIPVLEFRTDHLDEDTFAELFYVNMLSSYLSAALLNVEPFNQPGVEMYKKNLYRTLGKPSL